jgi:NAD(P)-dependent dehydrogenase (short-subunit alcohol dehydrogenase family)
VGRLDGKVALITGAAGGMGREAAKLFVAEGARVVMTDVVEDAGREAAEEIGDAARFIKADVSKAADAEAMVRFAVETFGGLHVLYNNAGVILQNDAGAVETDEETWDRTMAINLKGVWLGCKFGIPALLASGGGSIINVASFVALMGAATAQIAYTATKGGVLSMTREVAVEYARRGIRANSLCPGPIETPLLMQLFSDDAAKQRRVVHIPMGRLGQAEEVVRAALWLASDDSSFMTGAALVVDGGITSAYVTPE